MNSVWAIASLVIKELYRRKDFYVLFVLTALITLAAGSVNFFNDDKIVRILRDVCMLLIWISALVIVVTTTARQIPAERESRTIFPLLAKPVSRWQVVLGKFFGCWFAAGLALVVFYTFFGIVTAAREHHLPFGSYFTAFWLQWAMLGIVAALVLLGSVVFTAPSANATICLIIVFGILLVGGHLNKLLPPGIAGHIVYAIYFVIPHLEWYDIRDQVVNEQQVPKAIYCLGATLYAAVYAAMLLVLTWLGFRGKRLNV